MGYVLPLLDFEDNAMRSHLSAAVFLGMLLGGLLMGIASDAIGRKPCLQISMAANARALRAKPHGTHHASDGTSTT